MSPLLLGLPTVQIIPPDEGGHSLDISQYISCLCVYVCAEQVPIRDLPGFDAHHPIMIP